MVHVALYEPEIAPNVGNIARLCAATGASLHLIGRLGFRVDDRSLRRAGVDYWDRVDIVRHADWQTFVDTCRPPRVWAFSARGRKPYTRIAFEAGGVLLFGGESNGLPEDLKQNLHNELYCIPMPASGVRSLNLSTAVGIVLYESLRQIRSW